MMNANEDTSAPTSCSAHGALPASGLTEASNALFRATVPVEELERFIDLQLSEARRDKDRARTMYGDWEFVSRFAAGKVFALGEFKEWLASQPREQAPARNDKVSDASDAFAAPLG